LEKEIVTKQDLVGRDCPECKKPLSKKFSKKTQKEFVSCTGFPECRFIEKDKSNIVLAGYPCPDCGKDIHSKKNKDGDSFDACVGYPNCKYTKSTSIRKPSGKTTKYFCPLCKNAVVIKKSKAGNEFIACTGFPNCKYTLPIDKYKQHVASKSKDGLPINN